MASNYNENELKRLQEDAARRVRDMQERSQRSVGHDSSGTAHNSSYENSGNSRGRSPSGSGGMNMPSFTRPPEQPRQDMPRHEQTRHEPAPPHHTPQQHHNTQSRRSEGGILSQLMGAAGSLFGNLGGGGLGGLGAGLKSSPLGGILKGLSLDGDMSIILMVLLMISGEEVDELLVMALIYIML